jgi:hypothetical protein
MANIIEFPAEAAARGRRRRYLDGKPLAAVVESSLRLLRLSLDELSDRSYRANRAVRAKIGIAADELEMALELNSEAAARDLRETVLTALGPGLTRGEVAGARKALQLMLDCLPDFEDG